jgi:hypothetical protein
MRLFFGWWEGVIRFGLVGLPLVGLAWYPYLHAKMAESGVRPEGI